MVIKLMYLNDLGILYSTLNNKKILSCIGLDGVFLKEMMKRYYMKFGNCDCSLYVNLLIKNRSTGQSICNRT